MTTAIVVLALLLQPVIATPLAARAFASAAGQPGVPRPWAAAAPRSAPESTATLASPVPGPSAGASSLARSGAPASRTALSGEPAATSVPSSSGAPSHAPRATTRPRPRSTIARAASVRVAVGRASWYCVPGRSACTSGFHAAGAYAAAGPAVRALLGRHWTGRRVAVTSAAGTVTATLIDWCACPGGVLLDLYGSLFARLGSLSAGIVDVSVEAAP